jgi:hypothetical protein
MANDLTLAKKNRLPALGRPITENDVPEYGWLPTGVFLSEQQQAVVDEAKRHETITTLLDGDISYSVTTSYLLHVGIFAKDAGLPDALMKFDVSDTGEIFIARWHLPDDDKPIIEV